MKSNVGSTTSANSGSNIIGFNFGEKEHEGRHSTLKTIVINKLKGHFKTSMNDPQFLINGFQKMIWKQIIQFILIYYFSTLSSMAPRRRPRRPLHKAW